MSIESCYVRTSQQQRRNYISRGLVSDGLSRGSGIASVCATRRTGAWLIPFHFVSALLIFTSVNFAWLLFAEPLEEKS